MRPWKRARSEPAHAIEDHIFDDLLDQCRALEVVRVVEFHVGDAGYIEQMLYTPWRARTAATCVTWYAAWGDRVYLGHPAWEHRLGRARELRRQILGPARAIQLRIQDQRYRASAEELRKLFPPGDPRGEPLGICMRCMTAAREHQVASCLACLLELCALCLNEQGCLPIVSMEEHQAAGLVRPPEAEAWRAGNWIREVSNWEKKQIPGMQYHVTKASRVQTRWRRIVCLVVRGTPSNRCDG